MPTITNSEPRLEVIAGVTYAVTYTEIDYGPRLGVTRVRTLDPCVTPEAKARRREALRQVCLDLIQRGLA